MGSSTEQLPWVAQERTHPDFERLLALPFGDLVDLAIEELAVESPEPSDADPSGEWTVCGAQLPLAHNDAAQEVLQVFVSSRSKAVVYASRYKGILGDAVRPNGEWAISLDDEDLYHWSEKFHGSTASTFVLAATDCESVKPDGVAVRYMHWLLSAGLYCRSHPGAYPELTASRLQPFNAQARFGEQ